MWTYTFCILATFASIALQPGEGLRCYECSNEYDHRCDDPFDGYKEDRTRPTYGIKPHEPKECDELASASGHLPRSQQQCKKIIQTNSITGKRVVERSCAWSSPGVDPCGKRYNHQVEHCSLCNDDGCNGAATNYITTLALIASIIVAKYLA